MNLRIGQGFDAHALKPGRPLIIGGVDIPYSLGLDGHSDADVLMHAICDALLGAANLGDIGQHFSPSDPQYAGKASRYFLITTTQLLHGAGYEIVNIDATIIAQNPKMRPYIGPMKANIAKALAIATNQISVKASTTEGMGYPGRGEGIAVHAIALIQTTGTGDDS